MTTDTYVDKFFKILFDTDDLTDEEFQELKSFALSSVGKTEEEVLIEIQIGIDNGFSFEEQCQLIKTAIETGMITTEGK